MEVHFTPEQEARIAAFAVTAGTVPEAVVKNAALRVLEDVPQGHAGRIGSIEDIVMDPRFEKMLHF